MQNKRLNEFNENKENTFKKKKEIIPYSTCFALRSFRTYWAESERPAFNQMSSMLRIRWWIHLYWSLLTSPGERSCRLSLTTACNSVFIYINPSTEFSSLAVYVAKPVHTNKGDKHTAAKQRVSSQATPHTYNMICSSVPLRVV